MYKNLDKEFSFYVLVPQFCRFQFFVPIHRHSLFKSDPASLLLFDLETWTRF